MHLSAHSSAHFFLDCSNPMEGTTGYGIGSRLAFASFFAIKIKMKEIIACYELIQLVIAHNNLANFETWIFFKWIFKTYVAVMLIANCFDITMAILDVAGHVISRSGNSIQNSTAVNVSQLAQMRSTLEAMSVGELYGQEVYP